MARRWLFAIPVFCLALSGCNGHGRPKKPDPTKGRVTGTVTCADTGKPARFASVILSLVPKKDEKTEDIDPLKATESTTTDLDGRFTLEAVEPGKYYAFATQEGYLDPERGFDMTRIGQGTGGAQPAVSSAGQLNIEAIKQWREHLTDVTVQVHHTAELSLEIERGAEINGTVRFDDASPAIGMHFQVLRKGDKEAWADVGLAIFKGWALDTVTDGHGRYSITNLSPAEYKVCASMPFDDELSSPSICVGDTFRKKDAKIIKLGAGEIASGTDITIPLEDMYTVSGQITALPDGHPPNQGTVRLLYADDRETARETGIGGYEGEFTFNYVRVGTYILQITEAEDADKTVEVTQPDGSETSVSKPGTGVKYADKEVPILVQEGMDDLRVTMAPTPPAPPTATPGSATQ